MHPGKLQSIRMLTDGMPRTMLLFADMMINLPEQNGYQYLQLIVDRATPIYQERLGLLSPAQKKVLSELAFLWDAASVDQLIPKCNMDGKTISALLNQLTQNKNVEKIKGKTKNLLYRLEERFFNLWFNMTQGGPQQRLEARALTDFLEKWYDQSQLLNICFELSSIVKSGKAKQDYVEAMSQALLNSTMIASEPKQDLYLSIKKSGLIDPSKLGDASKYFDDFDEAISVAFNENNFDKALELLKLSNFEEGRKYYGIGLCYQSLENFKDAEKYYLRAIKKGEVRAFNILAFLYEDQGNEQDAEKYYLLAIEKGYVDAIFNLAILYAKQGKEQDAEKYYLRSIEKGNVKALYNLANLYNDQGKEQDAEKYYLLAIENDDVRSLNNLAFLYNNQGKEKDAEKYYLLAIEKGDVNALFNLAILYANQGKEQDAEKYYLLAIENGHVGATNNLANLYDDQGKEQDAEKYYLLAIEKGHMKAINNLAILYADQGKEQDAEKYFLLAIEMGEMDSLNNLAILYDDLGKEQDAEKYYLLAIENGHVGATNNLAILYANQGNEKDAEKYFLRGFEMGDMDSLNNLAILYEKQGIEEEAEKYHLLAIEKGYYTSLFNLANLYNMQDREQEAEKYYLQAIEKGNLEALNNLSVSKYSKNKKAELKNLIYRQPEIIKNKFIENSHEFACAMYLYLGDMEIYKKLSDEYLEENKTASERLLLSILIHKQTNWVFNYFSQKPKEVEKFKPLYYATLHLLKTQQQELLKMPPEIEENVNDIISSVKKQQEFYYSKS